MVKLAVWSASDDHGPRRLHGSQPTTEADLERWVRQDPTLVRDGLIVVAQQLVFAGRERLDLLCIENRSRWLVVELKRDRMAREVAAQALDYVSLLHAMPADELRTRLASHLQELDLTARELVEDLLGDEAEDAPRDVAAAVVGLSADPALLRLSNYLAEQHDVPIAVVQLQAFRSPSGDLLILREATDDEGTTANPGVDGYRSTTPIDERWARVRAAAAHTGAIDALSRFTEHVTTAGLYARPYTRSVMVTPPAHRNRYLTVVSFIGHHVTFAYEAAPFVEFFPRLDADQVTATLGPSPVKVTPQELEEISTRLVALMQSASE